MRHGFSLVELSIVLVILGLLTGGILAGQNLIRAAELRAFTTEFQVYQTSIQTFRDKYFAIPGDMTNAEAFWGTMSGGTCPNATGGTGTQTCNGNGDGKVGTNTGLAGQANERFTFWQHLANAGMIEGSYTGVAGLNTALHAIGGQNTPKSRVANGTWFTEQYTSAGAPGSASVLAGQYGNFMFVGREAGSWPSGKILTPEEMWNVDTKLDDGLPAMGKVITFWWNDCGTGTLPTQFDAKYDLQNTNIDCTPVFRNLF